MKRVASGKKIEALDREVKRSAGRDKKACADSKYQDAEDANQRFDLTTLNQTVNRKLYQ